MEFFATCGMGLESALGKELRGLGMHEVRPLTGGVSFAGVTKDAYIALLWSRIASRILLLVGRVGATSSDELYEGTRALGWEGIVAEGATIAVSARGVNDELRDTRFTALRVKDAMCDCLRDARGTRPDVDTRHPDLRVQVNLHAKRATIYIDLSGVSLEKRPYLEAGGGIPSVHPTIAAAMLLEAVWPERAGRGELLVDPACMSGAVAIEAALIAADVAPGLTRSSWGFGGWMGHD